MHSNYSSNYGFANSLIKKLISWTSWTLSVPIFTAFMLSATCRAPMPVRGPEGGRYPGAEDPREVLKNQKKVFIYILVPLGS